MKDETIRVGDLVMVVRGLPCCGKGVKFGATYTVSKIVLETKVHCNYCGHKYAEVNVAVSEHFGGRGVMLSRLKKIHPPELPETVDERQEVEA